MKKLNLGYSFFHILFFILLSFFILSCSQKDLSENIDSESSEKKSVTSKEDTEKEDFVDFHQAESKSNFSADKNNNYSLSDYIHIALKNNVELQSVFASYQASLEKSTQASSLSDPTLSYGYFLSSVETRTGPQRHRFGIAQSFPWFGTLSLKGEKADAEAEARRSKFIALKNRVIFDVMKSYMKLNYIHDSIAISKKTMSLLKTWEEVLLERFSSGMGSHSDLVKLQVELGQLEDKILEFENVLNPLETEFNLLLNRSPDEKIVINMSDEIFDQLEVFSAIVKEFSVENLKYSPELEEIDSLVKAEDIGVKLARKKYYPDFKFGYDHIVVGDREGVENSGDDASVLMLSMAVPIYWWKNQARENEARLRKYSTEKRRISKEQMLESRLSQAKFNLQDSERKINLFRKSLIPKTEESIEASFTSYQVGKTTLLDVLDSVRMQLDYKLMLSSAESKQVVSIAELFMLTGSYEDMQLGEVE